MIDDRVELLERGSQVPGSVEKHVEHVTCMSQMSNACCIVTILWLPASGSAIIARQGRKKMHLRLAATQAEWME